MCSVDEGSQVIMTRELQDAVLQAWSSKGHQSSTSQVSMESHKRRQKRGPRHPATPPPAGLNLVHPSPLPKAIRGPEHALDSPRTLPPQQSRHSCNSPNTPQHPTLGSPCAVLYHRSSPCNSYDKSPDNPLQRPTLTSDQYTILGTPLVAMITACAPAKALA